MIHVSCGKWDWIHMFEGEFVVDGLQKNNTENDEVIVYLRNPLRNESMNNAHFEKKIET